MAELSTVIFVVEIIGIVVFALSGVMVAVKHRLDLFGVLVVGTITSVGGGVIRDILLGYIPPMIFRKPIYVIVAVGVSLVSIVTAICMGEKFTPHLEKLNPIINVLDAIGLGVFVIVGVNSAINAGYFDNAFLSIFVGTITGVGGSMMRDQLVGTIPMVLHKRIYAMAALFGAALYYLLLYLGVNDIISIGAGTVSVIVIRMLATIFRWDLPSIKIPE